MGIQFLLWEAVPVKSFLPCWVWLSRERSSCFVDCSAGRGVSFLSETYSCASRDISVLYPQTRVRTSNSHLTHFNGSSLLLKMQPKVFSLDFEHALLTLPS